VWSASENKTCARKGPYMHVLETMNRMNDGLIEPRADDMKKTKARIVCCSRTMRTQISDCLVCICLASNGLCLFITLHALLSLPSHAD
jgi:hypothetical protein